MGARYRRAAMAMLTVLSVFTGIFSAPMQGVPFEFSQPDGSKVPVVVWGDEYVQRVESPDGFTLVRNRETGWICYADVTADSSDFVATGRVYRGETSSDVSDTGDVLSSGKHRSLKRAALLHKHRQVRSLLFGEEDITGSASVHPDSLLPGSGGSLQPLTGGKPVAGSVTGLTILIDFSDNPSTVLKDSIADFLNKRAYTGYSNNGSVRDFFFDVSGGKVDYQNTLFGYYRAKQPKTYYDNSSSAFGMKAQELIKEALNWVKTQGFDYSTLSSTTVTSSRGTVKTVMAVNVLYAGSPTQGWSEGLWPHQGSLSGFSANGVSTGKYQISNIGKSLGIGTFCHENGHMVFSWPDLYDYGSESNGVGVYCIMCATGTTNPIPPCAYLRDFSGWDVVTDITDMVTGSVLSHVANSNTSFLYRNKSKTSEMFYIESKRRKGRFKTLPDSGFLIWHVDRSGSNDNEQMTATSHYLVSLEQADNLFELEKRRNQGKAGDLFRKGYKDRFDDNTQPAAKWWSGSASGMKIWNMSAVADTMTFSLGEAATTLFSVTASASEHGTINPSGKMSAVAGSSLKFAIKPDSGYQVDAILVNGVQKTVSDTLRIDNITADVTISVTFGPVASLTIDSPQQGDVFYAGDTIIISWQTRGVKVAGISLSYSADSGKTFAAIAATPIDSSARWIAPLVESDRCRVKVADTDGIPSVVSGVFSIRKKPVIAVATDPITISLVKGETQRKGLKIDNTGTGELRVSAAMLLQRGKIKINEISAAQTAGIPDGMEIFNGGQDLDLSGWEVVWVDNKNTSGSYTFPDSFVLRGGASFILNDLDHPADDTSAYIGGDLIWTYNQGLDLAVSLVDAAGAGVDFVKTGASTVMPPEGTVWSGKAITVCNEFMVRTSLVDSDSADGWTCSASGSMGRINPAEKLDPAAAAISVVKGRAGIQGASATTVDISFNAANLPAGTYVDTLVIAHNDPAKPSPLRIPCVLIVTDPLAVKHTRSNTQQAATAHGPVLIAAPNPVEPGAPVNFRYTPAGNERSGVLTVYDNSGYCVFKKDVSFDGVTMFNRAPLHFSWQPRDRSGRALSGGTVLACLSVIDRNGVKTKVSALVGLR